MRLQAEFRRLPWFNFQLVSDRLMFAEDDDVDLDELMGLLGAKDLADDDPAPDECEHDDTCACTGRDVYAGFGFGVNG